MQQSQQEDVSMIEGEATVATANDPNNKPAMQAKPDDKVGDQKKAGRELNNK